MPNGYEQEQSDKRINEIREAKMDLKDATTQQLEQELEDRKAQKPIMPAPLVHPNFDVLRKEVVDYLKFLCNDDYTEQSAEETITTIFEAAINSFYHVSVWDSYIIPAVKWQEKQMVTCPNCKNEVQRMLQLDTCTSCGK